MTSITRVLLAGQSPSLTPEPSGISVLFFSAGVAGVNMLADNLSTLRLSRLPVNISTGLSTDPTVIKTSKNPSNIRRKLQENLTTRTCVRVCDV